MMALTRRIGRERSIVVACDVASMKELLDLVGSTADIDAIGAYKIGFALALKYGLGNVVDSARELTGKPIIYDHQKGGTDVPHTGSLFAELMADSGVDYAILFPFASPSTETAWIRDLHAKGIRPIIGSMMTIPDFLKENGGFLDGGAVKRILEIACGEGVTDFVLPGNKPLQAASLREVIESKVKSPSYFLPGIGAQGGEISSISAAVGSRWHAIVGRAIYGSKSPRESAAMLAKEVP
ncbi:MAG: orotidine 5'-phosphate decarboxylase [Candidatus Methanomethylicia archaeon]|nr:orotidine 5'-phosphate decarboxylase [Candidatus Methanomethylicia archaeon]